MKRKKSSSVVFGPSVEQHTACHITCKCRTTNKSLTITQGESSFEQMRRNVFSALVSRAMRVIGQNPEEVFDVFTLCEKLCKDIISGEPVKNLNEHKIYRYGLKFGFKKMENVDLGIHTYSVTDIQTEILLSALLVCLEMDSMIHAQYGRETFQLASASALHNFSRDEYTHRQGLGSRGGKAYKSYSYSDFLDTQGLNVTAAAKRLGISRDSVYAMRREHEHVNYDTGEVTEGWYQDEEGFDSRQDARERETAYEGSGIGHHVGEQA